jgi:hypothetical protein
MNLPKNMNLEKSGTKIMDSLYRVGVIVLLGLTSFFAERMYTNQADFNENTRRRLEYLEKSDAVQDLKLNTLELGRNENKNCIKDLDNRLTTHIEDKK